VGGETKVSPSLLLIAVTRREKALRNLAMVVS